MQKLNLSKEGTAFPNSSNISRTALVYLFVPCSVLYFLQLQAHLASSAIPGTFWLHLLLLFLSLPLDMVPPQTDHSLKHKVLSYL